MVFVEKLFFVSRILKEREKKREEQFVVIYAAMFGRYV